MTTPTFDQPEYSVNAKVLTAYGENENYVCLRIQASFDDVEQSKRAIAAVTKACAYHDHMAQTIARLLAAEKACEYSRMPDYARACAERIEALEALEAINKELNP